MIDWMNNWMNNWILMSSVLIVVILLIRRLFGERLTPGLQYGLWIFVAVRLLVPVNFFYSEYSMPELMDKMATAVYGSDAKDEDVVEYIITTEGDAFREGEEDGKYVPSNVAETTDHAYYSSEAESDLDAFFSGGPSVFYLIWLIGMAVISGIFLLTNLFFRIRIYSDREEIEEEELEKREMSSEIPVYVTKFVATPCLAGLKSPAVYIPLKIWKESIKSRSEYKEKNRELQAMVCHENIHYHHGDQFWGFLRILCLILHWYNPLVWLAALASKQDAELFCDAGAVRELGEENRYEYGRILLDTALQESRGLERFSVQLGHAGLCNTEMADTKKHIEKRIRKLTTKPKKSTTVIALALLFSLMAFSYLFIGSEGQDSLFWRISARVDSKAGEVLVTRSDSPDGEITGEFLSDDGEIKGEDSSENGEAAGKFLSEDEGISGETSSEDGEASGSSLPKEEEVEAVREKALAGMSEAEIDALTTYVKDYHNWMEYRLVYENWESRLSDKNSVLWNFFDRTGEVQAGWMLEDDLSYFSDASEEEREALLEKYPEFGKVSLEELGAKYGEPFYEQSSYGADTVIQRMGELTASAKNEIFQSDVEALCEALRQAKDTHDVSYVIQVHEILHDMEYFLLRYAPRDIAPYTKDKSLSGRYYGSLEVWQAWQEGGL